MAMRAVYNFEALFDAINRDNATLLNNYYKVTRRTTIYFRCHCGEESSKGCLQIVNKAGAFCKKCTRISWTQKQKDTNLERYDVECTVHASHIKKQIKENNLEKYGVENVFQSKDIQEKIKKTILEKYNVEHPSQNKEVKEKTKQTCIERYNVENPMQCDIIKKKLTRTIMERYNVEHISQTPEFKEKIKQTCLERYGVEFASQTIAFREKVKQSFIEHYDVDNPNKVSEIRDKIKQTCLEKYGVEHPLQNKEIMEKTQKNAKKYKEYKMPSGTIRKVQGYEPFALDELVKTYTEEDIISDRKDIPRICYKIGDKQRHYFPDIYIPSKNKIIEVKSTWTYKCKEDNIQEKAEATKKAGYGYEVWIYDSKGNKIVK
jgi:hypothetical protein